MHTHLSYGHSVHIFTSNFPFSVGTNFAHVFVVKTELEIMCQSQFGWEKSNNSTIECGENAVQKMATPKHFTLPPILEIVEIYVNLNAENISL